jgi:hypothetical protein
MSYLVTGDFSEPDEAQRAKQQLLAGGIRTDHIHLSPGASSGRKGGEAGASETRRRFAGLEMGLISGVTVGFLMGLCVVLLGSAIAQMMQQSADANPSLPFPLVSPFLSPIGGALIGLIVGGLTGGMVDYALGRLRAQPLAPPPETPVAVRCDEAQWPLVYSQLSRAGAHHLSVSEMAAR